MLNIELIRFEAQDVITASGIQAPVKEKWNGVHDGDCASAINFRSGDSHQMKDGVLQGYHDNKGWFKCICGCHED